MRTELDRIMDIELARELLAEEGIELSEDELEDLVDRCPDVYDAPDVYAMIRMNDA